MAFYTLNERTLILNVRACPGAKREGFEGLWNNTHVKIALRARAVDGKANDALIDFLAETFKVKKNDIILMLGKTARLKTFKIENLSINISDLLNEITLNDHQ